VDNRAAIVVSVNTVAQIDKPISHVAGYEIASREQHSRA